MFKWILRLRNWIVKPLLPIRFCHACGKEIPDDGYRFAGEIFCGYFCVPAVLRAHRAEVKREQLHREAEQLKRTREVGV